MKMRAEYHFKYYNLTYQKLWKHPNKPLNVCLSNILVHSEQVAIPARHTETVDTLAAAKNNIQCAEMRKPVPSICSIYLRPILKDRFRTISNTHNPSAAMSVR